MIKIGGDYSTSVLPSGSVAVISQAAGNETIGVYTPQRSALRVSFDYSAGRLKIGQVPANSVVSDVVVKIAQAFTPGVSIEAGDGNDPARLMDSAGNAPQYAGHIYHARVDEFFNAATDLYVTLTGTSATGEGEVIVYYAAL